MPEDNKNEAAIPNPALQPLSLLVGEWKTTGKHRLVPDTTLHGRVSFTWLYEGAFLMMEAQVEEPGFPSAIAIIGSDDTKQECYMLYFDERGTSRKFEVTVDGNTWKLKRDAAGFSQRSTTSFADNGDTMVGVWELSEDDSTWMRDLEQTYTRVK